MNDPETAEDRASMQRLARGEDGALDELIERHAPRLHAYLLRLLQNEADAEDLAQETFVRVYEHRARFDPAQRFPTWLYTIATNLVRDRFRWRSRHPETALETAEPAEPGLPSGPAAFLPDPAPWPTQHALNAERAEAVREAVAALPPELRQPLVLAEFEERPHAEIAAILGCTAKAVELRIYRARQRLRVLLQRWLA